MPSNREDYAIPRRADNVQNEDLQDPNGILPYGSSKSVVAKLPRGDYDLSVQPDGTVWVIKFGKPEGLLDQGKAATGSNTSTMQGLTGDTASRIRQINAANRKQYERNCPAPLLAARR